MAHSRLGLPFAVIIINHFNSFILFYVYILMFFVWKITFSCIARNCCCIHKTTNLCFCCSVIIICAALDPHFFFFFFCSQNCLMTILRASQISFNLSLFQFIHLLCGNLKKRQLLPRLQQTLLTLVLEWQTVSSKVGRQFSLVEKSLEVFIL